MELYERYRFFPATVFALLNLVVQSLDFGEILLSCQSSSCVFSCELCLWPLDPSTFQLMLGDTLKLRQSSVSRCCRRVGRAIALQARRFIQFPDPQECTTIQSKFQSVAGE
ncbi:hypothetical protein DPMN_061030 [Dreissena polymorpha]|uniref:Uncharacterized protein n=1 Tax=Dreissena polymorpha TaxID=45954 RepID=A0A9D4C715_DREPO|nr:hypothetical protein DPMN_061030 [Dreissena polymorpha]